MHFNLAVVVGAVALLSVALPDVATAETFVTSRVGAWQAFGGTDNAGVPVCGVVNSYGIEGRSLVIKTWSNTDYFAVQIFKDGWRIPPNQTVRVQLQFDQFVPWEAKGIAIPPNGTQIRILRNVAEQFFREFSVANTVTVYFPDGSEPYWQGGLRGSAAMTVALLDCAVKLTAGGATQPYGNNSQPYSTPSPVTQPYGSKL
jgi:hypothetical protein